MTAIAFPRFYFCSKGARSFSFYCAAASDDFDLATRFVFLASRVVARSARPWCLLFHVRPCHTRRREVLIFVMPCLFPPPFSSTQSTLWYPAYTYRHDRHRASENPPQNEKGPNRFRRHRNVNDSNELKGTREKKDQPQKYPKCEGYFWCIHAKRVGAILYSSREKRLAVVVVVLFIFLFWGFLLSRKSPSTAHRKEKWKRQADEVMRKGHEKNVSHPQLPTPVYCPGAFVVR